MARRAHKMAPKAQQRLQNRSWNNLVRDSASSRPLFLDLCPQRTPKRWRTRIFELFVDTSSKKRGLELADSLSKASNGLALSQGVGLRVSGVRIQGPMNGLLPRQAARKNFRNKLGFHCVLEDWLRKVKPHCSPPGNVDAVLHRRRW